MSRILILLFVAFVLQENLPAGERIEPNWIWSTNTPTPGSTTLFRKSITVTDDFKSAVLCCAFESTSGKISLDQTVVATLEAYDPISRLDLTDLITIGKHELLVECTSVAGPSAFFVVLELASQNGETRTIVSDSSWTSNVGSQSDNAVSRGQVDQRLIVPADRRVGIVATDNYAQWKQALKTEQGTAPASFQSLPGFEIELVRSALPDEDSWVSMAFDPQGDVIIAKEQQGILRMKLSIDGSSVEQVEAVNDTLKECRGLAFIGSTLFANANNSKGLYRIDPNDNGGFGAPKLLYKSSGGVGHGRNDLAVGPDQKLYSIHGDSVQLPIAAIDFTAPHREARCGETTSEGHLLRIDPESGDAELLSAGLRNPFGIDFNAAGDIFTYDADAEYDMGAPWYRPTRVSHLVTGGDYGWRGVTKSWPSYYPDHADNAFPNLDIGKGSPTAVKFGTRSHFPKSYQDALFILDWSYGRIIAVHMVPRGASYLMTGETFLKGRPLNVTDLDFAPDGSMYFVTGGRRTQSGLYRVRYVGETIDASDAPTAQQIAREQFAKKSRNLRRQLEAALLEEPSAKLAKLAIKHLADDDRWIQHAARNLLERQPAHFWIDDAVASENIDVILQAMLVLSRQLKADDNKSLPATLLAILNRLPLKTASRSQKLSALYSYQLCFSSAFIDDQNPRLAQASIDKVSDLYPDDSYVVNRLLSELLTSVNEPSVIEKTMKLLRTANDQTEQMQYLYVLRNVKEGWTNDLRRDYFAALAMTKDYIAGEGMNSFLKKIREEAIETLSDSQRQELGSLLDEASNDQDIAIRKPRPFVRNWTVDELLNNGDASGKPNLHRGEQVFVESGCIKCHRFGTRGTWVGPDLTSVARRFSRRDMLTSIIHPSKVVSEKYRSLQIVTTDGAVHVGQVTLGGDFRRTALHLAIDPNDPLKTIEIPKADIESQNESTVSWMPEDLLNPFTRDEILDLLAYLRSP